MSLTLSSAATTALNTAQGAAPRETQREQLSKAAKQFEAIFVRQMLTAARKTDFGGDILGGQGMDTFRQMQDEKYAAIAADTGAFGLASMIEAQLARHLPQGEP